MQDNAPKTHLPDDQPGSAPAESFPFRQGNRRVLIAAIAALADLVLFFPVFVVLAVYLVQRGNSGLWLCTLVIPTFCGAWLASGVRQRSVKAKNTGESRMGILEIPLAIVTGLCIAYWLNGAAMVSLGVCTLAWVVLWLRSAHHYRTDLGVTLVPLYIVGLLVQFIALFFFHHLAPLSPWAVGVTWSGLVGLAITTFALNETRLNGLLLERDSAEGLPKSVKAYNRFLVILICIILWLVFAIRVLQHEASRLWWGLVHAAVRLLGWFSALLNHGATVKQGPHPQGKLPFGAHKHVQQSGPSHLNTFEIIILCTLLAFLVAVVMWLVWRKLIPLIRSWYQNYMQVQDDVGYVDEMETVRPEPTVKGRKRRQRKRIESKPWEQLPAAEKVRYLYRTLVQEIQRRGYVLKPSLTAAETTEDLKHWSNPPTQDTSALTELNRLYDEARYGEGVASPSAIDRLKDRLTKRD